MRTKEIRGTLFKILLHELCQPELVLAFTVTDKVTASATEFGHRVAVFSSRKRLEQL